MSKWVIAIMAVVGLGVGIWMVSTAKEDLPRQPPAQPPSINPFPEGVAATGIVEAASRNVAVAPPEPGLVTTVFAETGERVEKGQPLFGLDRRPLEAQLLEARGALRAAEAELAQLRAMPRPEDIPPLEAAVAQAQAQVSDARDEFQRTQGLYETGAANQRELQRARYALEQSQASLAAAQADLARMQAGAWEQQIAVAEAQVAQARAAIEAVEVRLGRLTVTSPITGTVIKRNIEPGEYASPNTGEAAMVLGDLTALHVRAQVDEEDVVEVRPGAEAVARPRGAFDVRMPLTMLRIEPLAIPKQQLTGVPQEQIDTRVVEVVFRVLDTKGVPIYPGQLVDVYIDTDDGGKQ